MFCTKCGKQNNDGATFCTSCGAQLASKPAQAPVYQPAAPAKPLSPVEKIVRSPLLTFAIICTFVGFLFTFFSWFAGNGLDYALRDLAYMEGVPSEASEFIMDVANTLHYAGGLLVVVNIVCNLPLILTSIGLFVWLFSARSEKKVGGLGAVKAGVIIDLIFDCLVIALSLIVSVVLMVGASAAFGSMHPAAIGGILVFVLLLIGVLIFTIFYVKGILSTIKATKCALLGEKTTARPSMFVAVIGIIAGGISIISGLINLVNPYINGLVALTGLLNGVAIFLFAIAIISGKKTVLSATAGVATTPAYTAPASAPVFTPEVEAAKPQVPTYSDPSFAPMTEDSPTQFCIHCGKGLKDGEICSCREEA
ncbi:MAG: zinc-ribbon domain-containing protein [Clostridia bacterium]|nr:zinc-ribbon domain-containing protein [Clostridia bacterium]